MRHCFRFVAGGILVVACGLTGCRNADSPVAPDAGALAISIAPHNAYPKIGVATRFRVTRTGSDTTALNFAWNFGDGTQEISTSADTVQHVFPNAGSFQVVCRAMHAGSNTVVAVDTAQAVIARDRIDSTNVYIRISPNPFGAAVGDLAKFTILRTGSSTSALTFVWDFHDGSPAVTVRDDTISHVFAMVGTYEVTCSAFEDVGSPAVASDRCKAIVVESMDVTKSNFMFFHLGIMAKIHHRYGTYNGQTYEWTYTDNEYEDYTTLWSSPDTLKDIVWAGTQFSGAYKSDKSDPRFITVLVEGTLTPDHRGIENLSYSYSYSVGIVNTTGMACSYDLSNISLAPQTAKNERMIIQNGNALHGHVNNVTWWKSSYHVYDYSNSFELVSWTIDNQASLVVKFLR